MDEREAALRRAAEIGFDYLSKLPERAVGARADAATIASRLGDLADEGMDPTRVVEELATAVDPGLVTACARRGSADLGQLLETAVFLELRRESEEIAYARMNGVTPPWSKK